MLQDIDVMFQSNNTENLKIYGYLQRPNITGMHGYLSDRLNFSEKSGQSPRLPTRDALGNLVVVSPLYRTEPTLDGPKPAQLIVSPYGVQILQNNRKLLHELRDPRDLIEIGSTQDNRESRVVRRKVVMGLSQEDVVVKYVIPTTANDDVDWVAFTIQADEMRVAQLAQVELQNTGLQFIVPLLATIDMSLSRYVPHGITQNRIIDLFLNPQSLKKLKIEKSDRRLLQEIVKADSNKEFNQRFLVQYSLYSVLASAGLVSWLENRLSNRSNLPFSMIHGEPYQVIESERPQNKLVTIPDLYRLWQWWQTVPNSDIRLGEELQKIIFAYRDCISDFDMTHLNTNMELEVCDQLSNTQQQFLNKTKQTFHILELIIGSRQLQNVPNASVVKSIS